jgi:hypothetical protein
VITRVWVLMRHVCFDKDAKLPTRGLWPRGNISTRRRITIKSGQNLPIYTKLCETQLNLLPREFASALTKFALFLAPRTKRTFSTFPEREKQQFNERAKRQTKELKREEFNLCSHYFRKRLV